MREFHMLERVLKDEQTGILTISEGKESPMAAHLACRREGGYLALSVSVGPIEIGMRLRVDDVRRVLSKVQPVPGLQTTRQVGSGQAFLGLGLRTDGYLVLRPTLVADATGHMCLNLCLPDAVRDELYQWLKVEPAR
ncbi:MAG: hypothetical protein ACOCX5_01775 [Chloroflexota bacterium]